MDLLKKKKPAQSRAGNSKRTTLTFSGDDLTTVGRLLGAGQVMLPTKHPILGRIKAAMTRMNLPVPKGL